MRFQAIYDIAELCAKKGISNAVLCPGSRCAPLTLAFTRHPKITSRTFSDERSAGFIALGLAQQSGLATAVICTSGTAVYNLAPAVAEGFFSETPMVIFSADRPTEWIAQHDGQTIFQSEIFGRHVKKFFQLPQDYDHTDSLWAINRIVNEAINLAMQEPRGPVHINCPFREPLYPEKNELTHYNKDVRVIDEMPANQILSQEQKKYITSGFSYYHRILIVAGQHPSDDELVATLNAVQEHHELPIVADIISNLHGVNNSVKHADLFLGQAPDDVKETLQPDLLISFGQSLVSKNVKLFLRKFRPRAHWHVQAAGAVADPFKSITEIFRCSPKIFFNLLNDIKPASSFENQKQTNYAKLWEIEDRRTSRAMQEYFTHSEWSELSVVRTFLEQIPQNSSLHLANSMSVRYANFFGIQPGKKGLQIFSNRGTSGIDGCTSTALGSLLSSGRPTFLITGDVAFFYDRNAFWHNYPIGNFRVLLLNNHGGLIFNLIDGPSSVPESEEYFVTKQKLSAKALCTEFGFDHTSLDSPRKLKNAMKDFLDMDGRTKVLEIESEIMSNKKVFDDLKLNIKKRYEL